MKILICPVCGTEFLGELDDDCPYCDWEYDGIELSDEEIWDEELKAPNPVTLGKARQLFKDGKNIWGEPLNNKRQDKQNERKS